MKKDLTHMEAWQDFYEWMEKRREAGEINAIPKDVQEAKYTAEGLRQYPLGDKRIKSLLTKYAASRYTFTEKVTINE